MASDGIVELCNRDGIQFSEQGLIDALKGAPVDEMVSRVHGALRAHAQDSPGHDDMSLLILDCPGRE